MPDSLEVRILGCARAACRAWRRGRAGFWGACDPPIRKTAAAAALCWCAAISRRRTRVLVDTSPIARAVAGRRVGAGDGTHHHDHAETMAWMICASSLHTNRVNAGRALTMEG